mgnify:CR=1 FL=1
MGKFGGHNLPKSRVCDLPKSRSCVYKGEMNMKIFQVDSKNEDDLKLLYKLQNASKLVLCKNLRLCYDFNACLESMEREGYIKQLDDEEENILFLEEVCLFVINHEMIIYMTQKEFNKISEYLNGEGKD